MTVPTRSSDCQGKAGYSSKGAALKSISERQTRARRAKFAHKDRKRFYATLSTYHCTSCHQWHVGGDYSPRGHSK